MFHSLQHTSCDGITWPHMHLAVGTTSVVVFPVLSLWCQTQSAVGCAGRCLCRGMAEFRVTFSQGASVYPGGKWSQRLGLEQGSGPRCGGKSAVVTPSQAHTSSQHAHEQNLSSCWNETVTQSEVWTQFDSEVTFSAMGTAQVSPARAKGGQGTHMAFAVWGGGLWDLQGWAGLMFPLFHLASVLGKKHRLGTRNAG